MTSRILDVAFDVAQGRFGSKCSLPPGPLDSRGPRGTTSSAEGTALADKSVIPGTEFPEGQETPTNRHSQPADKDLGAGLNMTGVERPQFGKSSGSMASPKDAASKTKRKKDESSSGRPWKSARSNAMEDEPMEVRDEEGKKALSDGYQKQLKDAVKEWAKLTRMVTARVYNNIGVREACCGQVKKAMSSWQLAAEAGLSAAHFNMAVCLHHGNGTSTDVRKAIRHYEAAARSGHQGALYNLSIVYHKGAPGIERNMAAAGAYLQSAARKGLAQAQRELGVLCTEGPVRDMSRAARFFQLAANQQDPGALYFLGVCYERGWGVTEDVFRAVRLYRAAAAAGHGPAAHNLAALSGCQGLTHHATERQEMPPEANKTTGSGVHQVGRTPDHSDQSFSPDVGLSSAGRPPYAMVIPNSLDARPHKSDVIAPNPDRDNDANMYTTTHRLRCHFNCGILEDYDCDMDRGSSGGLFPEYFFSGICRSHDGSIFTEWIESITFRRNILAFQIRSALDTLK